MTKYSDETIYQHFLLVVDEIHPFSIRIAAKAIQSRYGILVGEDKLRRIIQTFGRKKEKQMQQKYTDPPIDYSWTEEWAERFAIEHNYVVERFVAFIREVVKWAKRTTPEQKIFPWH